MNLNEHERESRDDFENVHGGYGFGNRNKVTDTLLIFFCTLWLDTSKYLV